MFAAQAQGTPPPILRCLFTPAGGTPTLLTGENSAILQRNVVNDPDAGIYTVQASNTVGTTSNSATLVVGDAPQFVLQPAHAVWNPILTNTQPINPLVITQQMNLTNRVFQFYRVNPPP